VKVVATQAPLRQMRPVAQALPQAPQLALDVLRSASQPSTSLLLQLPKPALQVSRHALPLQVFAALGRDGQAALQAPQLALSLVVFTSQPSPALLLQFAKPPLQVKVHVLLAHTVAALARVGQALLQAPQLVVLVVVFTSQPLPPLASQSAKPGRQP
jgi:hypothetical protein